jgi:hypothetical protein
MAAISLENWTLICPEIEWFQYSNVRILDPYCFSRKELIWKIIRGNTAFTLTLVTENSSSNGMSADWSISVGSSSEIKISRIQTN